MNEDNAQCLIFVPANKRRRVARASLSYADQPEVRGYVLIRKSFVRKYPAVIEFFSHCDMQIITNNQDCTNFQTAFENQKFGIFEVQLEYDSVSVKTFRVETRTWSRNVPGPFSVRVCEDDDKAVAQLLLRVDESDISCFLGYSKDDYITAIDKHNLKVLKNVLPLKTNIDNLHNQDGTILHFATQINEVAFVNLLLQKECCVNAKGPGGLTPLHIAAKDGDLEIVESLLQHGADVNARATFESFKDCTPLVLSVRYDHLKICKALLSHGSDVDVNFDSDLGTSILELAVKQDQHLDIVKSILEHQPDVNDDRHRNALLNALCYEKSSFPPIRSGTASPRKIPHNETVQLMLNYGFSVNIECVENLSDVLFGAVHKNCIDVVRTLLQIGVDVNLLRQPSFSDRGRFSQYYTPLHVAVEVGDENIIQLLIDQGADIDAKSIAEECNGKLYDVETATGMAIQNGQLNILNLLLSNGAKVRNDPRVMCAAASTCNLKIVELLLQYGAPLINKSVLESPLEVAICEENMELLEVLFNYGAQLNSEHEPEDPIIIRYTLERPYILQYLMDQSFFNTHFIAASGIVEFFSNSTDGYYGTVRYLFDNPREDFQKAFSSCANIVARHIIKQDSANVVVSEQNVAPFWYSQESIDDFRGACKAEITKMKQDKVCGNVDDETEENNITVTFYDILTQNVKDLAGYAKNETIVEAMETERYETKFPIFAGVLKCQFQKGCHRAKLVKEGIKSANRVFRKCQAVASKKVNMELILDFLSNRDLLSLNNVFLIHK